MSSSSGFEVRTVEQATVVTFTDGSIVESQHIRRIGQALTALVEKEGNPRLVLDMSVIEHLSSSALGILLPLREKARRAGGNLVLCGLRPKIFRIFQVTRLERHFAFRDDEKAALAVFKEG